METLDEILAPEEYAKKQKSAFPQYKVTINGSWVSAGNITTSQISAESLTFTSNHNYYFPLAA